MTSGKMRTKEQAAGRTTGNLQWGWHVRNPQRLSFQIRYRMSSEHTDHFERPVQDPGRGVGRVGVLG